MSYVQMDQEELRAKGEWHLTPLRQVKLGNE